MSGSVFKNYQVPPNWSGYGMPSYFSANCSGTSQVVDVVGKAPMTSAPPVSAMTQNAQYSTTTTARPFTGNSQMAHSRSLMHRWIHCRRIKGL